MALLLSIFLDHTIDLKKPFFTEKRELLLKSKLEKRWEVLALGIESLLITHIRGNCVACKMPLHAKCRSAWKNSFFVPLLQGVIDVIRHMFVFKSVQWFLTRRAAPPGSRQ